MCNIDGGDENEKLNDDGGLLPVTEGLGISRQLYVLSDSNRDQIQGALYTILIQKLYNMRSIVRQLQGVAMLNPTTYKRARGPMITDPGVS